MVLYGIDDLRSLQQRYTKKNVREGRESTRVGESVDRSRVTLKTREGDTGHPGKR